MPSPEEQAHAISPGETRPALFPDGDPGAFRLLVEGHKEYAYRIAYKLLHDRDDAEDAVQESFIRVWNHRAKFREDVKFTTWLYKIVVNVSFDRIRARDRRGRIIGTIDQIFGGRDPAGGEDPVRRVETTDLADAAMKLARKLPPRQYLVFHLRDVLDLDVSEVSAMAGMSANSVKVNLCHARKKLREGLERFQETRS